MSKIVYDTSRYMAWFGGFVLSGLAVLSVVSISGRAFSFAGLGPVPGDFELVEAGSALAVFCFLPWCHLKQRHADVNLFWLLFPSSVRRVLSVASDGLMLFIWVLLVWRMGVATLEYRANEEVSFILQMPVWWGYAASMIPGVIGCIIYCWRFLESLGLVTAHQDFIPAGGGH
jgi:Tripartite ATP-independent periplasmic transporters, DctQ component